MALAFGGSNLSGIFVLWHALGHSVLLLPLGAGPFALARLYQL